jgi:GR25 family glycosyltransferase involved in LPS biosynthesis
MRSNLITELSAMTVNLEISPEAFQKIKQMVEAESQDVVLDKVKKLEQMVKDWEASMGEDDKTFYTLGIRRAIDVLVDNDPDILKQLPILEREDTPDE